jgi:hypothetical protein
MSGIPHSLRILPVVAKALFPDHEVSPGGEVAVEGLGGVGGDEEEGAVVVGVFPGIFDGGAGLTDAAHAVEGALAFDDDGAFGDEVLAEFGGAYKMRAEVARISCCGGCW